MKVNLMLSWAWGPWRQAERIYILDRAHVGKNVSIMEHQCISIYYAYHTVLQLFEILC